jgi:hypothetical protein
MNETKTITEETDPDAFAALCVLTSGCEDLYGWDLISFEQPTLLEEDHSLMRFVCKFEDRHEQWRYSVEIFHTAKYIEGYLYYCNAEDSI